MLVHLRCQHGVITELAGLFLRLLASAARQEKSERKRHENRFHGEVFHLEKARIVRAR